MGSTCLYDERKCVAAAVYECAVVHSLNCPHSLNCLHMSSSGGIHKILTVVDCLVLVTQRWELGVGSPFIRVYDRTRSEKWCKQTSCTVQLMCTTSFRVLLTWYTVELWELASLWSTSTMKALPVILHPSEHPVAFLPPPTIIFSLPKFVGE